MEKVKRFLSLAWPTIWNVGRDDPRRVIHALKVGSALTLVSLLYLSEPLFKGIGQNAVWAVMTVALVLEFTAGATLCKGLNRGLGTLAAGSLAFYMEVIAAEYGRKFRAIFIGAAVFVVACVSGYFNDEEPEINKGQSVEDPVYKGYIAVLDSKSYDETLALHASWEPRHLRHCYKFPGMQYVKLGAVLRRFGYTVVALHGCMQTEIKTPRFVRALFKDPCTLLAGEVSKALLELANSIRNRRQCSPEILSDHLNEALKELNTALKSQPRLFIGPTRNEITYMQGLQAQAAATARQSSVKTDSSALFDWRLSKRVSEKSEAAEKKVLRPALSKLAITSLEFSEALPFAAFASLLVESVARLDLVIEEVEELGKIASFKEFKPGDEILATLKRPNMENAAIFPE